MARPPRIVLALRWLGRLVLSGPFVALSYLVGIVSAVAALLFSIQTPYQLQMPGPAHDVQRLINPYPKTVTGALYLTTIYSDPANVAEWAYAKLNPQAGLVPREEARPKNVSEQEYQKLLVGMMDESKIAAKVVGLREAGYEVKITGQGARVREFAETSTARGVLEVGDIIVEADGKPVATSADLVALIQDHRPGDAVRVRLQRGQQELGLDVPLGESPEQPGRARAGIVIETHLFAYEMPKELDLKTSEIGGPSAGLMFALGVYNALGPEDITRGRKIAGTGTITTEGRVGAVGGVKYKAVSAEQAGAELFLAPRDNVEEARAHSRRMRVVAVETFADALAALREQPPAR